MGTAGPELTGIKCYRGQSICLIVEPRVAESFHHLTETLPGIGAPRTSTGTRDFTQFSVVKRVVP